jgi:hypothetical protein
MTSQEWNRRHAPGCRVRYHPTPGQPAYVETTTTAAAYTLGSGRAVVKLAGMRVPAPLAQVQAIEPERAVA